MTIQEIRVETAKVEQQAELLEVETVRVDHLQEVQKNQSQMPEPSTYTTLQLHICFYKSDGTTKADKADEKETVTVAKDAKTVYIYKNHMTDIRHYQWYNL